ncbi:MAG: hypothetical protein ABSE49_30275 [Polyangiaceae bacterium]
MSAARFVPVVFVAWWSVESPAVAQESPSARDRPDAAHWIAVEATAGVATPLGYVGASGVLRPIRWIAVHGGVGVGAVGVQWEAGVRASLPLPTGLRMPVQYLDIGASWSVGPYYWQNLAGQVLQSDLGQQGPPQARYWQQANWLNITLSVERTLGSVASIRPFVGVGFILNGGDGIPMTAATWQSCGRCGEWTPYVGVALAFGP